MALNNDEMTSFRIMIEIKLFYILKHFLIYIPFVD